MYQPSAATRMAMALSGGPGERGLPPLDLIATGEVAYVRVADATGLQTSDDLPGPEWIDREEWVAVNAENLGRLLGPLLARAGDGLGLLAGPARVGAGAMATAEAGALLGLVGGHVLGQYDIALGGVDASGDLDGERFRPPVTASGDLDGEGFRPPVTASGDLRTTGPRLLFVAPNVMGAADRLRADPSELLTWIALHEVTHAVQFAGVPWLQTHISGLIDELIGALDVTISPGPIARGLSIDQFKKAAESTRVRGLAALLGPVHGEILDRVQALMALIEGHAEWAMDEVAPDLVPNVAALRAAMTARRGERSGLWRLLDGMLGLNLKLRQYEDGRRFCDAVVEVGGRELLAQAWESPTTTPTLVELGDPLRWRHRIVGH